jgi:hypothetical protein
MLERKANIFVRLFEACSDEGAKVVISQHSRRAKSIPLHRDIDKWRHLIENFFCKLKEFNRVAMRADKTDQSYAAMI